jgi:hypothetical protein
MLGLPVRLTMPYLGGDFTLANDRHEPLAAKYPSETAALTLQEAARAVVEMAGRGKSA